MQSVRRRRGGSAGCRAPGYPSLTLDLNPAGCGPPAHTHSPSPAQAMLDAASTDGVGTVDLDAFCQCLQDSGYFPSK